MSYIADMVVWKIGFEKELREPLSKIYVCTSPIGNAIINERTRILKDILGDTE